MINQDHNYIGKMLNLFRNNPELYRQFNNMITSNNNNYINNFNNEEYIEEANKGNIPRRIFTQIKNDKQILVNDNNNNNCPKRNIKFSFSNGSSVMMTVPIDIKVKDLIIAFINQIGFNTSILDKDIYFLFNGSKIDINEEKTLEQMQIFDPSIILVIDTRGVLGAKLKFGIMEY